MTCIIDYTQNHIKTMSESDTFIKKHLHSRSEALICIPLELFTLSLRPLHILGAAGGNLAKGGVKLLRFIKPNSTRFQQLDNALPGPADLWQSITKTVKLAAAFFVSVFVGVFHPMTSYRTHLKLGFVTERAPKKVTIAEVKVKQDVPSKAPEPKEIHEEKEAPSPDVKKMVEKKMPAPLPERAEKKDAEKAKEKGVERDKETGAERKKGEAKTAHEGKPRQEDRAVRREKRCAKSHAHNSRRVGRAESAAVGSKLKRELPAKAKDDAEPTETRKKHHKKSRLARLFSREDLSKTADTKPDHH